MKVFIEVYYSKETACKHACNSFQALARVMENDEDSDWRVCLVGRETIPTILDLCGKAEIVVVTSRVLVPLDRPKAYVASIKPLLDGLKACSSRKMLYQDDTRMRLWWTGVEDYGFGGFIGTYFYPWPSWMRHSKKFWPYKVSQDTPCLWLPHSAASPQAPLDLRTTKPKVIFPSTAFNHRYPNRQLWYSFIQKSPYLNEVVDVLTEKGGLFGHRYTDYMKPYRAALLVVPPNEYIVQKYFQCMSIGIVPLLCFAVGHKEHRAPNACRAFEELGFKRGVHYVEVTLDNFEGVVKDLMADPARFAPIAKASQTLIHEGHLPIHRMAALDRWLSGQGFWLKKPQDETFEIGSKKRSGREKYFSSSA
jgi:hypothetical protein